MQVQGAATTSQEAMLMIYRELSDAAGLVMAESVINSSYKELPAGMEERYEMTVKPVLHHCLED